jgi:hypothetical protein
MSLYYTDMNLKSLFQPQQPLDFYILFIVFIKFVFILSAVGHLVMSHTQPNHSLNSKFLYWKERSEFIFIICMSSLLVYYFHPRFARKPINEETGLLFFLFGVIMVITAKWKTFLHEALWFR